MYKRQPLWQNWQPMEKWGSFPINSLSTRYPMYICSALTGGGAPAHPSPSLALMAGGLYKAFRTDSFVWQILQLFVLSAMVDDDGKERTRRRTNHKMNIALINTPRRSYRQQGQCLFAVNERLALSARRFSIEPQIVGIFKEICRKCREYVTCPVCST